MSGRATAPAIATAPLIGSLPLRARRRPGAVTILALAVLLLGRDAAHAQIVVVPPFEAGPSPFNDTVVHPEIGVAADGSHLFAWTATAGPEVRVATRRLSSTGVALAPSRSVDVGHGVAGVLADATGYLLALHAPPDGAGSLQGLRLDGDGAATAPAFAVSDPAAGGVRFSALAAIPSGTVFAWSDAAHVHMRLYDTAGLPRGGPITLATVGFPPQIASAALTGDRFVVVWSVIDAGFHTRARIFDADGGPLTEVIVVAENPDATLTSAVIANPDGGFTVLGFRYVSAGAFTFSDPTEVLALRRGGDGGDLGTTVVASLPKGIVPVVDAATDNAGNALVVWTEYGGGYPNVAYPRLRARGLAPDGHALVGPFDLTDTTGTQVQTAVRPDGTFLTGWAAGGRAMGKRRPYLQRRRRDVRRRGARRSVRSVRRRRSQQRHHLRRVSQHLRAAALRGRRHRCRPRRDLRRRQHHRLRRL